MQIEQRQKWTKKQCSTFICDIVCLLLSRDETVSGNELGGDMNVFSGREKYDLPPKQMQASPNLMELSVGAEIEIPIEKKYENQSKQIRFNSSPNLMVSVCQPPAFLDVS